MTILKIPINVKDLGVGDEIYVFKTKYRITQKTSDGWLFSKLLESGELAENRSWNHDNFTIGHINFYIRFDVITFTTETAGNLIGKLDYDTVRKDGQILNKLLKEHIIEGGAIVDWFNTLTDYELGVYIANDSLQNGKSITYALSNGVVWIGDRDTAIAVHSNQHSK